MYFAGDKYGGVLPTILGWRLLDQESRNLVQNRYISSQRNFFWWGYFGFWYSGQLSISFWYVSFSHKNLGVTQSLHGNVYKVMNFKGQVTMCYYFCTFLQVADRKSCLQSTIQSYLTVRGRNLKSVNKPPRSLVLVLYGIPITPLRFLKGSLTIYIYVYIMYIFDERYRRETLTIHDQPAGWLCVFMSVD